jgi:hypothetical protein
MPKRRWQWRQRDDHNDASAVTATMATAPKQRPRWGQCNACIKASGMLAMTPVATSPRKASLHDNFTTMGDLAKGGSFAKEGNFTVVGNFAKGGQLCQAK